LSLIYAAGLCQAAFLIAALGALPIRNRHALALLQAFIIVFSILLAENLQVELRLGRSLGLGLAIEFALAPLLYLFVRAIFRGENRFGRRDAWNFAPLVAAAILLIWLNIAAPGHVSLSNPAMRSTVATIALTKIGYFFVYAVAALREDIPQSASTERRQVLRNFRRLLMVFTAVYAFTAASFVAFLARLPLVPDSDAVGGVVLAGSLYAIGYFSLVKREIFDLRDPYAADALSAPDAAALRGRVGSYLAISDRFRDPDLTLQTVARALGVRSARLSQALNAGGAGGFNALINGLRLAAYQAARARAENADKTVLELAYEAGFNSKATFYRALRSTQSEEKAVEEPSERLSK